MKLDKLQLITGDTLPPRTSPNKVGRIAVLMSGGVDSSVTALKLLTDGWDVVGVNMLIPLSCSGGATVDCSGVEEVAARLDIPLYRVDLTDTFTTAVIAGFEDEYRKGRTPNPCCDCNRKLKFEAVWDIIENELEIKNVATGHYARIIHKGESAYIARGSDTAKDQSYFIYGITPERLRHFYLPLGDITKEETRELARQAGLSVAEKKESMDLCFAGGGDYRQAFTRQDEDIPGDFIDTSFRVVGRHRGIKHYTVGQRKLGMSFGPEPSYALRIIPESNQVMVGTREDAYKDRITAKVRTIHQPEKVTAGEILWGKIRSAGELTECRILSFADGMLEVIFAHTLFAPTPGQHLVLYTAEATIVAGGTIE